MRQSGTDMLGMGLYTVPEAARLVGVSSQRIRRWIVGYSFRGRDGAESTSSPIWRADAPSTNTMSGLSFLDMMEVRMVDAFRKHGVSFKAIREAAAYACDVLQDPHPFTMRQFLTDGNRIFAEAIEGKDERVLDMNRGQYVSKDIVKQSLFTGIEFEQGQTARWFPVANKKIVIDPDRSFGRPVLATFGVPTEALYAAYRAEDSIDAVANWFEVPKADVRAAVQFEQKAAA